MCWVYILLTGIFSFGFGMLFMLFCDYVDFKHQRVPRRWQEYLEYIKKIK